MAKSNMVRFDINDWSAIEGVFDLIRSKYPDKEITVIDVIPGELHAPAEINTEKGEPIGDPVITVEG